MKVHELVARCALAAESADPMPALRAVMEGLRGHVAEIERALQYVSGTGGNARQVFYRSPNLTLLKVCFPSGRGIAPPPSKTISWVGASSKGVIVSPCASPTVIVAWGLEMGDLGSRATMLRGNR